MINRIGNVELPVKFHYGAIKSLDIQCFDDLFLTNFNSTMVRLKGLQFRLLLHRPLIFQFHYGTIKSNEAKPGIQSAALFQFHYGTIKSWILHPHIGRLPLFQFHYGTIKRASRRIWLYLYFISIPLWYD